MDLLKIKIFSRNILFIKSGEKKEKSSVQTEEPSLIQIAAKVTSIRQPKLNEISPGF
jgi:hypothetical protein